MSYRIKYWTEEDVLNGNTETSEMEIIENPKRLVEGSIFHDIGGNAWEIKEICELDGEPPISISPYDLEVSVSQMDPESLGSDTVVEKIFVIDGVEPTAVEKKTPPPTASPTQKIRKVAKRHDKE